jgi:hypothetical protein
MAHEIVRPKKPKALKYIHDQAYIEQIPKNSDSKILKE